MQKMKKCDCKVKTEKQLSAEIKKQIYIFLVKIYCAAGLCQQITLFICEKLH